MENFLPPIEELAQGGRGDPLLSLGAITLLDLMNPDGFTSLSIADYYAHRHRSIEARTFHIFTDSDGRPDGYVTWESEGDSIVKCIVELLYVNNEERVMKAILADDLA